MTQADQLRLCILTPAHSAASMGGAEYQIDCLLEALVPTGRYDVTYAAAVVPSESLDRGYRVVRIGRNNAMPRFGLTVHAQPLLRALQQIRPDVIYQRVACGYTGLGAYYARRHGARLIWHVAHDQDVTPELLDPGRNFVRNFLEKRSIEYGLRHAHQIVTQTEQQATLLQQHYGRTADAVIPNFHPEPTEVVDKSGPISVVWVANFKPWKQPEVFVRVAASLSNLAGVRFYMVGSQATGSGDRAWNDRLMAAIRRTPNLTYLGSQSQAEVNRLLARSHIFVNTSLYEGFPNTFIQAWQRRVPVVSLHVNPDRVLDHEGIGIQVSGEDGLKEALRTLAIDDTRRNAMAERARIYAANHHSYRNAERLAQIIDAGLPQQTDHGVINRSTTEEA